MLKNYFDDIRYQSIKSNNDLIQKAVIITTELFEKDVDKGGSPYMLHLLYVYSNVKSEDEKVVALLHDILENKDVSYEDLINVGFSKKIVDDIKILTRDSSTSYEEYIDCIKNNGSKEAINVKIADLENNMDITRIKKPTEKDYDRIKNQYVPSHKKLIDRIKEMN